MSGYYFHNQMNKELLKNKSLESLINILGIKKEQKDKLREDIPELNEEQRKKLLSLLLKLYSLDREEERVISAINDSK